MFDMIGLKEVAKAMAESLKHGAEENLRRDGSAMPVALMRIHKGPRGEKVEPTLAYVPPPVGIPFAEAKDMYSAMIRELAAKHDADVVLFASEAWALQYENLPKGESEAKAAEIRAFYAAGKTVMDHPDRVEVVTVQGDLADGSQILMMARILRDPSGAFTGLGEWDEKWSAAEGRFAGFIRPKQEA